MPYETQLDGKVSMLGEQLTRLGRIETPPLQSIIPCPHPWNYRNHVQFHLNAAGRLGYMEAKGRKIFEIDQCHLPEPELATLWPGLQFEAGLGLERISLRLGRDGEAMLVLESPEPPELEIESGLSVVHLLNDEAIVMAGDDHLFMQVFDRFFKVSAGSFFQVNTPMAGRMVAHLLDRLPLAPQVTLLEVYCGVGLFSAFLAGRVGRLVGIEVSPSACSDFEVNLDEFDNVELYQASAGEVLPNLALKPEIILVDPPRAGLEKGVLDGILVLRPQCLAYISCDPATLARDAARLLAAGYQLAEVTPFDLFPQTCHIESISIFRSKETK